MREMFWPGIDFSKLAGNEALKKYAGEEFPASWCWTPAGKLFPNTYAGKKYRSGEGPHRLGCDLRGNAHCLPFASITVTPQTAVLFPLNWKWATAVFARAGAVAGVVLAREEDSGRSYKVLIATERTAVL